MNEDFGISATLANRLTLKEVEKTPKIEHSFQDLALEICNFIGRSKENDSLIFSLFYKHPERKIRDAFTALQKSNVKTLPYLLGILKKL